MNNIVAGIGDVLLRYPELIEDLTAQDRAFLDALPKRFIAVHLGATDPQRVPPVLDILRTQLRMAGVPYVEVGLEAWPNGEPKLRTHIEIVKRATGFIGSLSCFNCVAQLAKVPSFVLVNRAKKEPFIYSLMTENGARVEPWNVGKSVELIYYEAATWAAEIVREPTP